VTHPLLDHALIKARLDAVTEIMHSMSSVGVSMGEARTFSWSAWDSGHWCFEPAQAKSGSAWFVGIPFDVTWKAARCAAWHYSHLSAHCHCCWG